MQHLLGCRAQPQHKQTGSSLVMCCEHTCALQPHELVQLRLKVHGICFAPSEVKCFRFWEELWWCCCGGAVVVVLLWWCCRSPGIFRSGLVPIFLQSHQSFCQTLFVKVFKHTLDIWSTENCTLLHNNYQCSL